MIDLRDVRTQMLIVVGVLGLLSLGAIGLLLSPAGRSQRARAQEYERLRLEKIEKTRASAPIQGMDKKITEARDEETQFDRERLAQRYSTMSEQLSHIADGAGVKVSNVKYDEHAEKGTPPGFNSIGITMQVAGTYAQDMHFINAVERQKMFLLIDGVSFGGMQGDTLTVSVRMSTFLRSAA